MAPSSAALRSAARKQTKENLLKVNRKGEGYTSIQTRTTGPKAAIPGDLPGEP